MTERRRLPRGWQHQGQAVIDLDINRQIYERQGSAAGATLRELEALILQYVESEKCKTPTAMLQTYKQRLVTILLPLLKPPEFLTTAGIVPESSVSFIQGFHQGKYTEAIFYQQAIYVLACQVPRSERLRIVQLLRSISGQRAPYIITASDTDYKLWVRLKSQLGAEVITQQQPAFWEKYVRV
ncbi:MAG: hypothetical protein AAFY78_22450 [Cyanobacteria bacterium J06648_16]